MEVSQCKSVCKSVCLLAIFLHWIRVNVTMLQCYNGISKN